MAMQMGDQQFMLLGQPSSALRAKPGAAFVEHGLAAPLHDHMDEPDHDPRSTNEGHQLGGRGRRMQ